MRPAARRTGIAGATGWNMKRSSSLPSLRWSRALASSSCLRCASSAFWYGERRAVDALEHGVALVAAPVRAGHARELDGLEVAGVGHVRALAEVDPLFAFVAVEVERDLFARGDALDDLDA
jgi:hypothetical protein